MHQRGWKHIDGPTFSLLKMSCHGPELPPPILRPFPLVLLSAWGAWGVGRAWCAELLGQANPLCLGGL